MAKHKISISCIIEYKDRILLIKEKQKGKISWDIPAGGLDLSETLEDGVRREVKEETGVLVEEIILLNSFQYIEEERTTINFLFYSKLKILQKLSPEIIYGEDILDIQWFEKDKVRKLLEDGKYENNLAKARLEYYLDLSGRKERVNIPKVINA